jgi:uncharacterized lipoprotein YmbA
MTRRGFALALLLLAAGCGFFSRSKSRFFTLERIAPATAPVASVVGARGTPVGIDTLELPPGFDRRDIVVRKANQQLDVRGTDQWSAQLEPLVLHTLAANLAARVPEGMVILPGQAKPLGPMRAIDVAVEEFAAGPENVVVLDAHWVLRENGRPAVSHHERIRIDLPSLESANIATGFSQALAALADRIAAGLSSRA